jgi:AbrB family looped-hinge helix DNA binding protein
MYASYTKVGERGQITIPKIIRDSANIKYNDKLIVRIDNNQILIEKTTPKEDKNKLLEKGYKEMAKEDLKTLKAFKNVDKEANKYVGDY